MGAPAGVVFAEGEEVIRSMWRRRLSIVLACFVVAGFLVLVAVLLRLGARDAAAWSSVVGALTALAALLSPLAVRGLSSPAGDAAGDGTVDGPPVGGWSLESIAAGLAAAVAEQWREEARARRLQDPWPLPVAWRSAHPDLADHAHVVFGDGRPGAAGPTGGAAPVTGDLLDVAQVFGSLPHQRLAVLGAPGSGKSVFALVLTLALLERRQVNAAVPVLLPAASWDPARASFAEWIADYLAGNYHLVGRKGQAGRAVAGELVEGGYVLPVLDGLDEMPVEVASGAITELNRSLDRDQPIVVTCRTREYRQAVESGDVLTMAAVIELEALDLPTVRRYLTETSPAGARARRWAPILDAMTADPRGTLASVLRTPLMVCLARAVYGDTPRDPSELLDPRFGDPSALEEHLLDQLIPATYERRSRRATNAPPSWRTEGVAAWLAYLARQLTDQGRVDLAWWRMEECVPRTLVEVVSASVAALVLSVVFGPVAGVGAGVAVLFVTAGFATRQVTLEEWLTGRARRWVGRATGLPVAGPALRALVSLTQSMTIERWLAVTCGRLLAVGLGVARGLIVFHRGGVFEAAAQGVAVGLAVGLAVGFLTVALRATPREVQFDARRGIETLVKHLVVGLIIGLVAGTIAWALLDTGFAVTVGVIVGLVLGLVDGLNVWLDVTSDVTRALSPGSTHRADRVAAIARGLAVGLTIAITSGIAFTLARGLPSGLAHGLVFGVGFALVDRYSGVMATRWGRYLVARSWLAVVGRLPWRFMTFLDDAHRRGVLRGAGAAYQFRHARLQHRLASATAGP
jgi:hypothetical protein